MKTLNTLIKQVTLGVFLFATIICNAQTSNYEYVDLGLSVKWANKNVGADNVTDNGNFYAWAETKPKEQYDWTTYKYSEEGATKMTKYNYTSLGSVYDFKTELDASDDAATQNMGSNWRTPSLTEMNELLQKCTWTWYDNYNGSGTAGFLIKSKVDGYTDKSIFLPAAGHMGGKSHYDEFPPKGMYWTSTLDKNSFAHIKSCQLYFGADEMLTMSYDREIGMTIRAVYGKKQEEPKDYDVSGNVQNHDFVDLGLSVQWATCNIGAESPKQGGNLYAWAETETKSSYKYENYKYGKNGSYDQMTKYNRNDGLTMLESCDDAASVNWGNEWKTPTAEEFKELLDNCDWYGMNGCYYGISKINDNVIILSTKTGCRDDSFYNNRSDDGYYWTANKGTDVQRGYAWIKRQAYYYFTTNINRYFGYAVRPVLRSIHETGIEEVTKETKADSKDGVYLHNKKIVIRKNGHLYNLNGILLK